MKLWHWDMVAGDACDYLTRINYELNPDFEPGAINPISALKQIVEVVMHPISAGGTIYRDALPGGLTRETVGLAVMLLAKSPLFIEK